MVYNFQYDGKAATLNFSDVVGEVSELRYFDKGVDTLLKINEFKFNERELIITVQCERWIFYNNGTLIRSPEVVTIDATSQESIEYFANLATPKMSATVKRMMVNGVAISLLEKQLFDADGEFSPGEPTL